MPLHNPQRRKSELTRMNVNKRLLPSGPVKKPLEAFASFDIDSL
jgi:hypothetical protein